MILLKQTKSAGVLLCLLLGTASLKAQAPNLLNYQGKLTAGGQVFSDDLAMTFAIYSSISGGQPLWTEVQAITVSNGVFNALLGSTSESGIPNNVFTGEGERYLGIKIGNDPEMAPRFRLASAAFALRASQADAVAANAISGGNLQDNAVGTAALANGAVTADKIASGTITNANVSLVAALEGAKINPNFGAQNVVTTGNLGVGTTSPTAKLHISGTPGSDGIRFPDGTLQTTAATGSGSGDITSVIAGAGLSGGGITGDVTLAIGSCGIGPTQLADDAVTSAKIEDGTIGSADIAAGAITNQEINASAAISGTKISPNFGAQNLVTTGRIGIGTDSPAAKLHINGTSGVDGIRFPDGSMQTTAFTGNGGNFALPIAERFASSNDAFMITATGTGRAGSFEVDNQDHGASALRAASNGNANSTAIFATHDGAGSVAGFEIRNAANDAAAVYSSTINSAGYAGYFQGRVHVQGTLSASSKAFKIDHPQDPANKYLSHACVESAEMMNIYNGNATLDAGGAALVILPDWFMALNRDFRYQLTPLGAPGPNLYIAEEISNNRFKIAGGTPGSKVSWQVTGVRQDAFANAHRVVPEQEKSAAERGYYVNPEVYGQPAEKSIYRARHSASPRRATNGE